MKYRIIYQTAGFYFEAEAVNEQERKEVVKGLIYTTKDLGEASLLGYPQTCQSVPENYENEDVNNELQAQEQPQVEYATEGQKKYMTKLGIAFTETTTKIEAIDLINEYKVAHGIPLGKKIK